MVYVKPNEAAWLALGAILGRALSVGQSLSLDKVIPSSVLDRQKNGAGIAFRLGFQGVIHSFQLQQYAQSIQDELHQKSQRCFWLAQQNIALECRESLIQLSPRKYRGHSIYPPEYRNELQWLDQHLEQLAANLNQVSSPATGQTLQDNSLLSPEAELPRDLVTVVRDQLLQAALQTSLGSVPTRYRDGLQDHLFAQLCATFVSELKTNEPLAKRVEQQLLVQINAHLVSDYLVEPITIQDLEEWLTVAAQQSASEVNGVNKQTLTQRITPDRRYFVSEGRLCRCPNPLLDEVTRSRLHEDLVNAQSTTEEALRSGDAMALRTARARLRTAKVALGERGPVWWTDGTPDYSGQSVEQTPYADWYASLSG